MRPPTTSQVKTKPESRTVGSSACGPVDCPAPQTASCDGIAGSRSWSPSP